MQLIGRHFDTGQLVRLDIQQGRIAHAATYDDASRPPQDWPWIAPGLIDLQLNGYAGQEFCTADITPEKVGQIIRRLDAFGVTRVCPTLTTQSLGVMEDAAAVVAAACESDAEVAARVAGIHVEGPFLSTEDGARGAHPRQHCRPPKWDEFQRLQQAAGGRIRILTMAVEFEGCAAFIRRVADSGVVVSIGHTAANTDQIRAAVDAGARMSTHLGNGSHPVLPRHNNYIWDQLAEDRLTVSLIGDGHHLPPPVLKSMIRAKTPARCILVSDIAGQAGLPPGRYPGELCDVEVLPSGRLVIAGQTELMAGASQPIGVGIANVLQYADVSLAEAASMATHNPAKLLGIEPGGLEPDCPADLVCFRLTPEFEVVATILAGALVFGSAGPVCNLPVAPAD